MEVSGMVWASGAFSPLADEGERVRTPFHRENREAQKGVGSWPSSPSPADTAGLAARSAGLS